MKIVYFGSSQFGVPCLESLIKGGHTVSCVVTQPDKRRGRHLILGQTRVKEFALSRSLRVYQPADLNAQESVRFLRGFSPELFVVIAYGQLLSQEVLDIPSILPLNVHASLLPKYRGAAPVNWALINGETKTGISVMKMVRKMDAGPVIVQEEVAVADADDAASLQERLSQRAPSALRQALEKIQKNACCLKPQDDRSVTFAPRLTRQDGLLRWHKGAQELHDLVRGCIEWPGAFTHYRHARLKIHRTCVDDPAGATAVPGEVLDITKQGIVVATGKGLLRIIRLQSEGRRVMDVAEFCAGHPVTKGDVFI